MVSKEIGKNKKNSSIDFFLIIILFLISFSLRIYNYKELGVHPDEILYSDYTYSIILHQWSWPREFMWSQPPLLFYILAILTNLFEGDLMIFRLVTIIFGSLSVSMMYILGKELFDRKVGILSSILLSFSGVHILYSRTLMLESTVIFFILGAIYFFWKSYQEKRNFKIAVLAGIFLGLTIDTKYVGLLLIPTFVIFILWNNKTGFFPLNLKSLMERNLIIIFLTSLIVISPVLINLYLEKVNPFYYMLFGQFKTVSFAGDRTYGILDLVIRGYNNYVDVLVDKNPIISSFYPAFPIFYLAASILLGVTIIFSVYYLLKSSPNISIITIFFIVINLFVAYYRRRFDYYLLWSVPAFYIMISYLLVDLAKKIRPKLYTFEFNFFPKLFLRISIIVFGSIFIFSSLVFGALSSSVNEGLKIGYEKQISDIANEIQPGEIIVTDQRGITNFYLIKFGFNSRRMNIYIFPLYKTYETPIGKVRRINFKSLETLNPRFIITDEFLYNAYTRPNDKKLLHDKYYLNSNKDGILLFKRKND
jgi:hypothetical protein